MYRVPKSLIYHDIQTAFYKDEVFHEEEESLLSLVEILPSTGNIEMT